MALHSCPECRVKISPKASVCPACGLSDPFRVKARKETNDAAFDSLGKIIAISFVGLLYLVKKVLPVLVIVALSPAIAIFAYLFKKRII
jgi:hypothetical protein